MSDMKKSRKNFVSSRSIKIRRFLLEDKFSKAFAEVNGIEKKFTKPTITVLPKTRPHVTSFGRYLSQNVKRESSLAAIKTQESSCISLCSG